jgi:transcriptional regulator with XRE-family HTH domain
MCTADVHTGGVTFCQAGAVTGWLEPFLMSDQDVAEEVRDLCAQLRATRRAKGLSIRAVAAAASVAPYTVTRVEAGTVSPSWATYAKLANAREHVVGVRAALWDWGEVDPTAPFVAPWWWLPATRGPWWKSDGSDRAVWLQLRAVGSELCWARLYAFPNEITEAEAARLLGMSRTTVHAIERLSGNPLLSSVVRLADLTRREVVLRPAGAPRPVTPWEATRPPSFRRL